MKNPKYKFVIVILAFIIGVVGVWISEFLPSLMFSNTQSNFSILTEIPLADDAFIEQTFESFEIKVDQTPNNATDLGVFNPSGDYHPLNRPTEESERFVHFDLEVKRKKRKLVAWGDVRGVQASYKFTSVSVTEKHLKFSTGKVGGVSYDFDGKFLGIGDFASQSLGNGNLMLEGTLRKFVDGKKVMDVSTSFVYFPGC
ncbi:MAG: hypothetical protein H7070_09650 [Saprospiraceae bacterium]|nr:hypothetical protein [Pyrinomonadaceae bacterium]